MTCIALMGLEFTCYDPRTHDHLNHTISRGVAPLTGYGFQYDPRTDSKESAPEIDLPLHSDTFKTEVAPPLQQDSIASPTSSSSRGIAAGMLVIGLLAGFVSGFLTGQRMAPAPPVQAAGVPRAAQPPAPQPPATQAPVTQAPATQPPTPVAESPVVEIPQKSPNRTAASEPAGPQSSESAPSRPTAPAQSRASESAPARPPQQPASSRAAEPAPSGRSESAPSRAQAPPSPVQTARPVTQSKPAMLELVSRPLGATVFVDEVRVGVTPVTVNDVMPGTRLIRMELLGHQTWRTSVNVEAGAYMRVGASLE